MGQNFLVQRPVLRKIVGLAEIKPEDIILEVGPGIGTLTLELAKKVKKVIAVEKDRKLAGVLKEILKNEGIKNVEVTEEDILKFQISNSKRQKKPKIIIPKNYKVVANLPYNIAAAVVMKFLEAENPPKMMVVFLQKEVGQRIVAKPPRMNKLAVFCQFFGKPELLATVSKKSFWPQPKVDSAILKIQPNASFRELIASSDFLKTFSKIVRAGFSHPRKQLVNNFHRMLGKKTRQENCFKSCRSARFETEKKGVQKQTPQCSREEIRKWLKQNNIQPTQRAESLSLNDWVALAKTLPKLENK